MTDQRPASQDDIDALLAEVQGAAGTLPPVASDQGATTADNLVQDDIDALLAEITKTADQQQPAQLTLEQTKRFDAVISKIQDGVVPETGSLGLTPKDLDQLVAKHAAPEAQPAETMISQEDIDALVQQLSAAVGGGTVPATAAVPASAKLTKTVINPGTTAPTSTAVPQPAPAPGPRTGTTSKPATAAKPVSGPRKPVSGGTAAVAALPAPGLIPVLAPAELRGARWLLVAAVALLAICALAMGTVAQTVSRLSRDLVHHEVEGAIDADQFALALTAARSQLASHDDFEAAQGMERLKQLRERFPTRTFELTLEMARHWRSIGAYRKAADEYAGIIDRIVAQPSDPRLLLEDAECLAAVGENDDAVRLIYVLLAHERGYLSSEDALGHPRPAEDVQRDRLAVQQAYLLLGQLLSKPERHQAQPAEADHGTAEAPAAAHEAAPEAHVPAEGHH
jgi:hypothetical protein